MKFAVFASGQGGNLQAIINAVRNKKIKADLKLVFSDRASAFALTRARKAKIPTLCLDPKDYPSREDFDRALVVHLRQVGIEGVVLAGYMRLFSPYFIKQYEHKIINIHPALLPAFKGTHGIRDAFDYGVKVTGVSVHFVVEEMDAGTIIAQDTVVITPRETLGSLQKKIHALEHKLYPKVIAAFVLGKCKIKDRKVTG